MVRPGLLARRKWSDRTTPHRWSRPLAAVAALRDPAVRRADPGKAHMPAEDKPPTAERRPPITVVLIYDESLIRVALAQALASSGLGLVGEAATGEDAVALVVDVRPDVVLMDLQLPGMSGVQAIQQLGLLAPATRVLVLTRSEQNRVVEAILAGASGYILKSAPL